VLPVPTMYTPASKAVPATSDPMWYQKPSFV
jgi:hypothetical protein